MAYVLDPELMPRMSVAWGLTLDYLVDRQWHPTAEVETYLAKNTDLAPRTIRNLLEQQSRRRGGRKPLSRRGNALGKTDTREIRLR